MSDLFAPLSFYLPPGRALLPNGNRKTAFNNKTKLNNSPKCKNARSNVFGDLHSTDAFSLGALWALSCWPPLGTCSHLPPPSQLLEIPSCTPYPFLLPPLLLLSSWSVPSASWVGLQGPGHHCPSWPLPMPFMSSRLFLLRASYRSCLH